MSTIKPSPEPKKTFGPGRVLITVYAILAIGAISRAVFQMITAYSTAPIPITLSAISGVVYLVATIALIRRDGVWYRVAWATISFELLGVLVVGTLSVVQSSIFADEASVWSYYGVGYLFIPVVLPVLGMVYLSRRRPVRAEVPDAAV
jgi:hypothetical protein